MKKAFIDIHSSEILGHCFLDETISIEFPHDQVEVVEFDDSIINPDYLIAELVEDVWVVSENLELKTEKQNISIELKKMEYGKEVLAYIGVSLNDLDISEYQSLLADNNLFVIQTLLRQGALESCHALLMDFTPNEIITQLILDKVQLKLQYYINQL